MMMMCNNIILFTVVRGGSHGDGVNLCREES